MSTTATSNKKTASPSTTIRCLGTKLIDITLKDDGDSSAENRKRASIMIELVDSNVIVYLCDGSQSYQTEDNIPTSTLLSTYNKNNNQNIHDIVKHLFGLGDQQYGKKYENSLHASFENNTKDQSIILTVREVKKESGLAYVRHQTKLIPSSSSEGIFEYCQSKIGDTLNETLREIKQLKSELQVWKFAVDKMGKTEQTSKDKLLSNFLTLRNALVKKHQKEIEELKVLHEEEKKQWNITNKTTSTTKRPRKRPVEDNNAPDDYNTMMDDVEDNDNPLGKKNAKDVFSKDMIDRLAEGKPLNESQKRRKRILDPSTSTDFDQLMKERNKFKDINKNNKETTKQQAKNCSHSDDETEDDNGDNGSKKKESFNNTKSTKKRYPSSDEYTDEEKVGVHDRAGRTSSKEKKDDGNDDDSSTDSEFKLIPKKKKEDHTASSKRVKAELSISSDKNTDSAKKPTAKDGNESDSSDDWKLR
jgi:hypothetical protein